jgi:type II secretory pathway component GspD/PulD (secretin)
MSKRWILAAVFVAGALTAVDAQDKPLPAQTPAPTASTPGVGRPQTGLRVQILLARYQGEKRISSLPFVLGVVSNGSKTSLRVGTQLPIASTMFGPGNQPSTSYSYRDVGTNIDCQAQEVPGGTYNLAITISDSSVQLESQEGSATKKATVSDVPAFRAFNASFNMLLRDGQTLQYASATDSVSGEVVKIDVTLNVLK